MSIKKMFLIFIILTTFYIVLSLILKKDVELREVSYDIKNDVTFKVNEFYSKKTNDIDEAMYFEVSIDNNIFSFQRVGNFKKQNYMIKDIRYYKNDSYTCIYPIFKDNYKTDILCMKDNIIYPYSTLKNKDAIIPFIHDLADLYQIDETNESDTIKKDNITIFTKNLIKNHYIGLESYKGLYLINSKVPYKKVDLFSKDQYKKDISTFINGKYFVADYNSNYQFHEFYLVDLKSGKDSKIVSDNALKLDSYVMGSIDNKVYVYDKSKKEQYSVDIKEGTIRTNGNTASGIKVYSSGKWKDFSSYDAYDKKVTFNIHSIDSETDKVGNYYYYYEKDNNIYHVYQASYQNKDIKTYLFDTTDIEDIVYLDNFIYFINDSTIYRYEFNKNIKRIVVYKELEFNKTVKFGVV